MEENDDDDDNGIQPPPNKKRKRSESNPDNAGEQQQNEISSGIIKFDESSESEEDLICEVVSKSNSKSSLKYLYSSTDTDEPKSLLQSKSVIICVFCI